MSRSIIRKIWENYFSYLRFFTSRANDGIGLREKKKIEFKNDGKIYFDASFSNSDQALLRRSVQVSIFY